MKYIKKWEQSKIYVSYNIITISEMRVIYSSPSGIIIFCIIYGKVYR